MSTDDTQDPSGQLGSQVRTADLLAYWYDIDGLSEVTSTPPVETRIQLIAAALRTQHSLIYAVERMLGLEKPVELGS